MSFAILAVEILAKILIELPYEGLLGAERVCKLWHAVIGSDPHIQVQLFRKPSKRYVRPRARAKSRGWDSNDSVPKKLLLHPAINWADFYYGDSLTKIGFNFIPVASLSISNNYMTVPRVKEAWLESSEGFKLTILNPKGVRVIDFFRELASVTNLKNRRRELEDIHPYLGHPTGCGCLELYDDEEGWGHPFYEGLHEAKLVNGVLTGEICSGS
ncbi:hypothetical protein BKA62DRAFT_711016 [Auriculariales sp. MPI-PUGE-AT-0066]|nr:hypothetical protein BKA62DRAFT_711016 [Auriculariales sp. MPI-PUGE-AT-0066]